MQTFHFLKHTMISFIIITSIIGFFKWENLYLSMKIWESIIFYIFLLFKIIQWFDIFLTIKYGIINIYGIIDLIGKKSIKKNKIKNF